MKLKTVTQMWKLIVCKIEYEKKTDYVRNKFIYKVLRKSHVKINERINESF